MALVGSFLFSTAESLIQVLGVYDDFQQFTQTDSLIHQIKAVLLDAEQKQNHDHQ
jgi:hypothetical protein